MIILGTGLSGLIGSRVVELLSPHNTFHNVSLETGIDITRKEALDRLIDSTPAPWVYHFAAKTDVDAVEKERDRGALGSSWIVNVVATDHIVQACKRNGKRLLYLSTDYVFDGTKDEYTESDQPNPLSWYAQTKYEGEKLVVAMGELGLVVRIANPYRARFFGKLDFVRKIIETLTHRETVHAPRDQLFVPTLVDDIAFAIQLLTIRNAYGIYHVVGSQPLSPYDAAQKIAAAFTLDSSRIQPVLFSEYIMNRAPRPFHAVLRHDKISELGIHMSSFDEGLMKIKLQMAT